MYSDGSSFTHLPSIMLITREKKKKKKKCQENGGDNNSGGDTHTHELRDTNLDDCPCKRTGFRFVSLGKTLGKIGFFTYVRRVILIRLCSVYVYV